MSLNPNMVPWMGLMGLIGLGGAYVGGRIMGVADPMLPAWWGLIIGVFVGLIFRVAFRFRSLKETGGQDQEQAQDQP